MSERSGKEAAIPAIVLAAGLSTRMRGAFKPLLPLGDRPMLGQLLATLRQVEAVGEILLVTGHRAAEVHAAATGYGAREIWNPAYESGGMVSSVQAGVKELQEGIEGFVLALADQPAVRPGTVRRLIDGWRKTRAAIAVPVYDVRRGHPVVFADRCVGEILALGPGRTLKDVVEAHAGETVRVDVEDDGVVEDIDTPEDYDRVARAWAARGR